MSEWNDIVITKPPTGELVLVLARNDGVALAHRNHEGVWVGLPKPHIFDIVRYWAPLPEMPE